MILFLILVFSALIYTGYDAYNKQKEAREFYNTLSAREAKTYTLIEDYKKSLNRFSKALTEYNNIMKSISYTRGKNLFFNRRLQTGINKIFYSTY